ncbi:MAG: autotransporter-associated beta strand repeat-containing protein [Verrucomicrobiota bacterium]|nr:autotransporter-associated beta strand repeat-containing protein [Verrucomicrobiota bacterium]
MKAQFIYSEGFTGTEAPGWEFATDTAGTQPGPRLTAGTAPLAVDPENLNSQIDADGSGWMRLATNTGNQSNAIALDTAIPSSGNNIKVSFDYTMWGGGATSPADGITVFLWDANVNFDPGAFGGSLGYAQRTGINGLSGGYIGVGLDVFGNFSNDDEGRSGGLGGVNLPGGLNKNQIIVRGPDNSAAKDGSGTNTFEYLAGTGGLNYTQSGTPAVASLNATTQSMSFGGYNARPDQDAADYRYIEMELDANNQLIVRARFGYTGVLVTLYTVDMNMTGVIRPESLRIGFAAATGGSIDVHEIRNLEILASGSTGTKSNYWDNQNGNQFWQTGQNWNNNTVPSLFDFVAFTDQYPDTKTAQTVILNGNVNPEHKSVTFSGATSYTINKQNSEILIFDSNTTLNKAYLNVLNSPNGNADHTINVGIRADDALYIQNLVHQTLTLNGALDTNTNPVFFSTTGTTNVTGVISGTGAITTSENGTTIFNGANTYSNSTTVQDGILRIRNNTALGTTAAGTTVQSGGTLQLDNSITVTGEAVTIAGTGEGGIGALNNLAGTNVIDGTAAVTLSANATISSTAGTLTIGGTGNLVAADNDLTFATASGSTINVSRVITDGGANSTDLLKTGAGVLNLSGNNTFGGVTTLQNGTIQVANANGLGNGTGTVQVGTTNTAASDDPSLLINNITTSRNISVNNYGDIVTLGGYFTGNNTGTLSGTVALNRNVNLTDVSTNTTGTLFSGVMSGTGGINKVDSGTVTLGGNNTFTGDVNITQGTLAINASDRIANTVNVIAASGSNFALNNNSDTIGSLAGAGNVQLGSGTLNAGGNNSSTTYSGNMSGSGSFTKSGTGTMTFTGTNSFTGNLQINSGIVTYGTDNRFSASSSLVLGDSGNVTDGRLSMTGGADQTFTNFTLAANTNAFLNFNQGTSNLLFTGTGTADASSVVAIENWDGLVAGAGNSQFLFNTGTQAANVAARTYFEGWGIAGTPNATTVVNGTNTEVVPLLSGNEWDGTNASNNWNAGTTGTDTNWRTAGSATDNNTAAPNGTGTTALFRNLDANLNGAAISLNGNRSLGNLIFASTNNQAFSISNDRLTFNQTGTTTANLTLTGNSSPTINSNISLSDNLLISNNSSGILTLATGTFTGNDRDIRVTGSGTTVISQTITETANGNTTGITKDGSGILRLSGTNTFAEGVILNTGTVQLGNNAALGAGVLTINGGTIQSNGASRTVTSLSSYAINGDFTVSDDSGTAGNQDLTINEGGTITGNRTVTVDTVNFTLGGSGGDLTSTGSLIKEGNGTLTMAGNNSTFSGGLTVNAGTVTTGPAFEGGITIGATTANENYLGTGNITVNTGGTLTTTQNITGGTTGYDFTLGGSNTLANTGGTITITNAMATEFDADLYLSGTINQSGGTTSFVDWNDMEVTGTSAINVSGGTLAMNLTDDFNTNTPNSNPLAINVTTGTFNVTLANAETNSAFTIGTDDTLTLNGASAAMNINTGAAANLVTLDGTVNLFNNGTLTVTQGTTTLTTTTKLDGGSASTAGTLVVKGDLSINEPLVANRPNITIDSNSATTITAPNTGSSITNVGTLTKTGTGTTTINSNVNNIEASQVVISGGTLLLGASDQLANSVNLVLSGTDTTKGFSTGGNSEVINSLALTTTGTIDMGAGASILRFLGGGTITAGQQLNVTNWSGTHSYGGGTDQIIFGETLPASFLNNVYWGPTYGYGATQLSTGEIVPVPEPATIAIGVLLLGFVGYDFYRRRQKARVDSSQ